MEWEFGVAGDGAILSATIKGSISLAAMALVWGELLYRAEVPGVRRFLLDFSGVAPGGDADDLAHLPPVIQELAAPADHRAAILHPAGHAIRVALARYERMAHGHGFQHRLFTDRDTALGWLIEGPPMH